MSDYSNWIVYGPLCAGAAVVLAHVVPYYLDPHQYRRPAIDGPWLNSLSDAWLAYAAAQGNRSERVHELHKKYGKFVRIAPNHISIADPDAIQIIYAHGNGTLKSEFYDAFVSIRRGLFNTRDRAEHTRKRKLVSHIFSQQNVLAFEPHIRRHVRNFCAKWDERCAAAAKGLSGDDWEARDGQAWFDCLPHYNYLAFDIIGDLAFGSPFGMIAAQRDSAPVIEYTTSDDNKSTRVVKHVPAIKILNDRGDFSASLGVLPLWARPWAKRFPWYARGNQAVQNLAGLAIAAVTKRLEEGLPDEELDEQDVEAEEQGGVKAKRKRTDLLEKLLQGKDENGAPMGREELTAEALTQLIAGSDTTSNSSCAITYYLAATPEPSGLCMPNSMQTCLDLRRLLHQRQPMTLSPSALDFIHGSPTCNPPGTELEVAGEKFGPGCVLSVPSFTIHRDKEVWGEDVDAFRPERWFEEGSARMNKIFNPFSYGPRACVGRNLATMELQIIISSIFRRYEFVLLNPNEPLGTREGFLRKPLSCYVGMKRREVSF
ncbi:cytochrome P450 family protein [Ceratobasidium sp. AG-Ba]|nr:cytochrome P450 family protein [Ceratobasidium sp. AG-Ba]